MWSQMHITELNSRLILTAGDNVFLYDTVETNQMVTMPPPDLPPNLTKGQLEVFNKQDRTISAIATSRDKRFVAVAAENKQVVIFDENLQVKKNFIVNRAASKVLFTRSGDILVADRTGDVYLYTVSAGKNQPILLLGHLSMILDMELSQCEKYIITCDRDEKIRVSHFPNTYNIVSFCLGHEEFVVSVKTVGDVLFSGSGDGTVRLWDYKKGEQLSVIDTNEFVSDKRLLEQFSKQMDQETVDVTALPVTDMQVFHENNIVLVAVSLHIYDSIQLYRVDLESYKWSVLKNIHPIETLQRFYLNHNSLYIFDSSGAKIYKLVNDHFCLDKTDPQIDNFYQKHKKILKIDDGIMILYKRKFDNVQEYLERKKLRLESSK